MSWYTNPQLFLYYQPNANLFSIWRIRKDSRSPLQMSDFGEREDLDFTKHFSLVNHKMSGFDPLISAYPENARIWKFINSQGLAATWDDQSKSGTWSHEEPNSSIWSLAKRRSDTEKQAPEETVKELQAMLSALKDEVEKVKAAGNRKQADLEKRVSALEAANADLQREKNNKKSITDDEAIKLKNEKNALINDLEKVKAEGVSLEKTISDSKDEIASLRDKNMELTEDLDLWKEEISNVQQQLDREKKDKQSLEKEVLQLKAKLEECCGAGGGSADREPWMSGTALPSTYVPFEELNDQAIPSTRRPLIVTKTSGTTPTFGEVDYTTNVQTSYFYRGMLNARMAYPIVLVNVSELLPKKEKARFDPNVWSLFNNAGTDYAARKPFESETST